MNNLISEVAYRLMLGVTFLVGLSRDYTSKTCANSLNFLRILAFLMTASLKTKFHLKKMVFMNWIQLSKVSLTEPIKELYIPHKSILKFS